MQVREAEAKRDAEISAKNEKLQQELLAIKQSHRQFPIPHSVRWICFVTHVSEDALSQLQIE
jgi:hypothetical protein